MINLCSLTQMVQVKMLKTVAYNGLKASLVAGSGRSSGEGNGNPLQYSSLGNPMDRGAWQATVNGIEKSWTQFSD